MTRTQACRILGIDEDADRKEVKKKYRKKYRFFENKSDIHGRME